MIGVYIQMGSMTVDQYNAIDAKVQESGISPDGCLLHTCFLEGDSLAIFDVWESKEAYEAFGVALEPLTKEFGAIVPAPGPMPKPQYVEMVAFNLP